MRSGLDRRLACREFRARRVEARGFGDRDGIDGSETVNDVEAEKQGNLEAGFLGGDALQLTSVVSAEDSQERSDSARADESFAAGRNARPRLRSLARQLVELPDFLLQGHELENGVCDLGRAGGGKRRIGGRLRRDCHGCERRRD